MRRSSMRDDLDSLTREYLDSEATVISEFSGDTAREWAALLAKVNTIRTRHKLAPLPAPDSWGF